MKNYGCQKISYKIPHLFIIRSENTRRENIFFIEAGFIIFCFEACVNILAFVFLCFLLQRDISFTFHVFPAFNTLSVSEKNMRNEYKLKSQILTDETQHEV